MHHVVASRMVLAMLAMLALTPFACVVDEGARTSAPRRPTPVAPAPPAEPGPNEDEIYAAVRRSLQEQPIAALRMQIEGDTLRLHGVAPSRATAERAGDLAQRAAPGFIIDNALTYGVDDVPAVDAAEVLEVLRAAVAADEELRPAVQRIDIVETDSGLVLRGATNSTEARDDLEDLARAAAPGVPIENEIAIVIEDLLPQESEVSPSTAP